MQKDKTIKQELIKLQNILNKVPEDKLQIGNRLIEQAAFLRYSLSELQLKIYTDGFTDLDKSGTPKESAAVRSYGNLLNRYMGICKQLIELLPKTEQVEIKKSDPLLDFMSGDTA